jgi:hypothetical protein
MNIKTVKRTSQHGVSDWAVLTRRLNVGPDLFHDIAISRC